MAYSDLLIWQYRRKPKARATIDLLENQYRDLVDVSLQFPEILNIKTAIGNHLDIIGKHVGQSRYIRHYTNSDSKFGFEKTHRALGFSQKRDGGGKFINYREISFSKYKLKDDEFRFLIKCRIAKNYQTGTAVNLHQSLKFIFDDGFWFKDNENMTAEIQFHPKHLNSFALSVINTLDILPRPAGVKYLYKLRIGVDFEKVNWRFGFYRAKFTKGWKERGKFWSKARRDTTPFLLALHEIDPTAYLFNENGHNYIVSSLSNSQNLLTRFNRLTNHKD